MTRRRRRWLIVLGVLAALAALVLWRLPYWSARFVAQLGLRPAERVVAAMRAMGDRLDIVSAERIRRHNSSPSLSGINQSEMTTEK